jgi:hypothetical protein
VGNDLRDLASEVGERGGVLAWLEYDEDGESWGEDASDERVEYEERLMGGVSATGIPKLRGKWAYAREIA